MEVVKDLTCPICLEFYSHPVILPCSHIMCKQPCAKQLFEGNFIRCPVCRDNCYVSGGLLNLPRVITIESIIEKIRAERKKRNATNQAQGKENSFDDVFSDVTSENRESDKTPTSSQSSGFPICNSPTFPEGISSPVCFSPRELINNAASTSNGLSIRFPAVPTPETPTPHLLSDGSSSTPRYQTESTTVGERSHSYSVLSPRQIRQTNIIGPTINTSYSHTPQQVIPQSQQRLPSTSNCTTEITSSSSHCHFTTNTNRPHQHISNHAQNVESQDVNIRYGRQVEQNLPSTSTFSLHRSHIHNENSVPERHLIQDNFNLISSANSVQTNSCLSGMAEAGTGSSIFNTADQIQTSTPRSDLRNIRLCHEQSLANLKACSDSIRALQQSRPFFRNNNNDSSEYSCGAPNGYDQCRSDNSEINTFIGQVNNALDSLDNSPRINETNDTLVFSPGNDSSFHMSQICDSSVDSARQNSTYFDISQSVCDAENSEALGNISPEGVLTGNAEPDTSLHRMQEDKQSGEVSDVKLSIQSHLQKLCGIQNQLLFHMDSFTKRIQDGEEKFDKGRSDINKECDSLVAEVENKRYNFLLHIDDERKRHHMETNDTAVAMQNLLTSSEDLSLFVEEMLESRPQAILSTASPLLDSLSSAVAECQACLQTQANSEVTGDGDCNQHLIDTRVQRSVVQGLDYLALPQRPVFWVDRCTRNTSTVMLVLQPPTVGDVIDYYEISYCSNQQKALGIEERYYAKVPEDPDFYGINTDAFPVILIENLCPSMHYFFCTCAVNRKGKSPLTDYVQCKTLSERDCVVPVPSVIENQCQVGATSVTLTCPSLATVTSHQCVQHCLLQKTNNGAFAWKGEELVCKREEFTVRRLRPNTRYNFAVITYNGRGECQVSDAVELQTHPMDHANFDTLYNVA